MRNSELTLLIKHQVEELPFKRNIDFALNICKRLLPDYISFYQKNKWGDPEKLKEAISYCEKQSSMQTINGDELNEYLEELETIVPDTDDFGDWDGSYALNSASAVLELLEYLKDRDKNHILNISSLIIDTIDFKISEEDTELTDKQLREHPKILEELKYQVELTK